MWVQHSLTSILLEATRALAYIGVLFYIPAFAPINIRRVISVFFSFGLNKTIFFKDFLIESSYSLSNRWP